MARKSEMMPSDKNVIRALKGRIDDLIRERENLQGKIFALETQNKSLKSEIEQYKFRLAEIRRRLVPNDNPGDGEF